MRLQQRLRRRQPFLVRQRQGIQQMAGVDLDESLAKALQKDLRAGGILVEQRGGGGEQQDMPVARLRAHRLFGQCQKARIEVRIGQRCPQKAVRLAGCIRLILARHLFRLSAKREHHLGRR
ncbi:hypothetical protein, partial [Bradyrhizobium sp.]|uniref:hypothetical protein n=1 Tax=Bradyrhizobium sp. TaxID=376 RepID=UPI0025BFA1BF